MFMHFLGGGIGHKSTDYLQQTTPVDVPDDVSEPQPEDIFPQNTQDHTQAEGANDAEGDSEDSEAHSALADEEADYGYVDEPKDSEDEGSDSDLEDNDSESDDSNHSDKD